MRYDITSLLLFSSAASSAAIGKKVPKGFVSREGEVFKLGGKDFYFAGSNAYYFPFNDVGARYLIICTLLTTLSFLPMSRPDSVPQRKPG
jgi:hypothetical protein